MIGIGSRFYSYFGHSFLYEGDMKNDYGVGSGVGVYCNYYEGYSFSPYLHYIKTELRYCYGNGYFETKGEGFDVNLIFII